MFKTSSFGWFKYFDYVILDLISLITAFFLSYWIRHNWSNPLKSELYLYFLISLFIVELLLLVIFDPLKDLNHRGYYKEFIVTGKQTILLMMAMFTLLYALHIGSSYSRIALFAMGGLYWIITFITRICWKKVPKNFRISKNPSLLIVASLAMEDEISDIMIDGLLRGYNICGFVLIDGDGRNCFCGFPVVAELEETYRYISRHWVDEVLVTAQNTDAVSDDFIQDCVNMGVAVHVSFRFASEDLVCKYLSGEVAGNPVTTLSLNMMSPGQAVLKRVMDIVGGLVGCVLTVLLYIVLAPWILIASPGPLIFKQQRIGINGKPFTIYKFRSMYLDAEKRKQELMAQNKMDGLMFKMDFDPRVIGNRVVNGEQKTGIGDFIRRHSLDEFPQFFNVLKGDMSLVGTRPPTTEEFQQYEAHHRTRLAVMPGITGLWQISGRSDIIDFEEVVRLDTTYMRTWNFGRDIKIIIKTIGMIFMPKGSA